MRLNIWEILVDNENECYAKSTSHIRVALIAGAIMYSLFGILDVFMLPNSYHTAWLIRFGIIGPITTVFFFFTYSPRFLKYCKIWLTLLVVLAQLGIVSMIYFAKPGEGAYWGYYAGLILVILWAVIMFRLSIPEVVLSSICNIIFYNVLAIGIQKMHHYPVHSMEFGYLINNNFFLFCTSFLALLGAHQLSQYKKKLYARNLMLTHEKRALKIAKEKAEESDRLKSAFLANMSHEIRTPMNAILGFGELLKDDSISKKKRDEYISIIQLKGNQLLHLINDIIDLSRIETNNITIHQVPLQINSIFDELQQTYNRVINQKTQPNALELIFDKSLSDNNSWFTSDGHRLKQILSNLIDNAIKFTAAGKIQVGYQVNDMKTIMFYVSDTGIGISSEKQPIIFDRFRQVHESNSRAYAGTGLGLSIVKSLVELMGGTIGVKSELNKGTEFYFTLPFQPSNDSTLEPTNGSKDNINWKDKTVLIAEDDEENYLYLKELLVPTNISIIRAKDGNEALEIATNSTPPDLVLLDVKMPGIDGYEVSRKLKAHSKAIPIIIQTAYAMDEDQKKAKEALCDEYISKPLEKEHLFRLMSKYLNRR